MVASSIPFPEVVMSRSALFRPIACAVLAVALLPFSAASAAPAGNGGKLA